MAVLDGEERARGVVTASAGNHAQGVALAARELGVKARIFMPVSTPMMKQNAVRRIGGNAVEVILVGDTYDDASGAAKAEARASGKTYIAPYDDIHVIGGQGTIADEIVNRLANGPTTGDT
jgi:threonine dehydratase